MPAVFGETNSTGDQSSQKGEAMNEVQDNSSQVAGDFPEITVIYDNTSQQEGLQAAWGFSCLIKVDDKTILFDTGGDGSILMANMARLEIDPRSIDLVVLSHEHWDHVGGLPELLAETDSVTVYLLKSFPVSLKKAVKKAGAALVEVTEPVQICEHAYSTGEMGTKLKEQALILRTDRGLVLVAGCAHPGIVAMVRKAIELTESEALLVMGGFHLMGKTASEIESIVSDFKKLGVKYAAPCHCTGEAAIEMFHQSYQEHFVDISVGRIIDISDLD